MNTSTIGITIDEDELKRLIERDHTLKEGVKMRDVLYFLQKDLQSYMDDCLDNFVEDMDLTKFIEEE